MKKKLLAMLLAAVLAVSLLPGTAFAADSDFVIEDGVLVDYKGSGGAVTIPNNVTSIGLYAFYMCSSLTSVIIPSSVTSIEYGAFYGCSSLTSVTIPSGVTSISDRTFNECTSLTSVTIPDSVTSIGQFAFNECSSLTSVTIPAGVTSIGDWAFYNCSSLTSVAIPASVTTFGQGVFCGCSGLTSVTIPASVTSIGRSTFTRCTGLTSVTIPDGVTVIDEVAFYGCSGLTSVTIPASVTVIGEEAFADCDNLKVVNYGGSEAQWGQILCEGYEYDPVTDGSLLWQLAFSNGGQDLAGLTGVTVNSTSTTEPTEPTEPTTPTFTDVPEGVWYYEAVQWAADKGYIQGYNGEFSPNGSLTRGAIYTILARVDNVDTEGGSTWYEKGMNWAVENGVSDGTSPTSDITLEMLVTMLYRYENKPDADTSVLARFSDSSSLHTWTDCREAMAWAVEIGLVEGSGGKLDPLSTLARYRGAVVLKRYCEKLGK